MLSQAQLESDLAAVFSEMNERADTDNPMTPAEYAAKEAKIIFDFVTSATVMVDNFATAPVATPAGPGTISGIAKGSLQ